MNEVCLESEMVRSTPTSGSFAPVGVIVPCYNEAESVPKLRKNLERLSQALAPAYAPRFILVDDGSSDETASVLAREFADFSGVRILRHERNLGIAAAIATGIENADTEIICSIDADCSYDPTQLVDMLPLLEEDVSLVVASPYHPRGQVKNVAPWRLKLSRTASGLYRLILHQKLYTYTSCFRVYRRSLVADIRLREPGFVGIAELVCQLDARGAKVAECPAVLDVRTTGQSKMRVLRAGCAHLRLILRTALLRLFGRRSGTPTAKMIVTGTRTPLKKLA